MKMKDLFLGAVFGLLAAMLFLLVFNLMGINDKETIQPKNKTSLSYNTRNYEISINKIKGSKNEFEINFLSVRAPLKIEFVIFPGSLDAAPKKLTLVGNKESFIIDESKKSIKIKTGGSSRPIYIVISHKERRFIVSERYLIK